MPESKDTNRMRLGVNIDHVATVRQARRGRVPDPVDAARACERAGADSIVCHLREDRRHIQDRDVARLLKAISTRLNLEMSAAPEIVRAALRLKPHQITLVPERRRELTTEGGLDILQLEGRLARLVCTFEDRRIPVSLFVDPMPRQIEAAARTGVRVIELHTGRYANAPTALQRQRALRALRRATDHARGLGLRVAAGHGLDYENVSALARLRAIEEVNIGFSIIARALVVGIEQATQEMKQRLDATR